MEAPPARAGHVMVFHEPLGRVVLFGGLTPAEVLRDTWEYDGVTWQQTGTAGPPATHAGVIVEDERRHRATALAGVTESGELPAQTWSYSVLAAPCASPGECGSGHCVDGLCCAGECGVCQACDTVEQAGICGTVRGDSDPDTCDGASACDDVGMCVPL